MILFHGTSKKRGKAILNEKVIKSKLVDRVYGENHLIKATTDGYIYLTPKIEKAIKYACNAVSVDKEFLITTGIYIFAIEIDEDDLEIDEDEKEVDSIWKYSKSKEVVDVATSLEFLSSVRVGRDLIIGKDVTDYYYDLVTSDTMKFMKNERHSVDDKLGKFEWTKLVSQTIN